MQKTIQNEDTALLDAIEAMLGDVNISFERIHQRCEWRVSIKGQFAESENTRGLWRSCGGRTLREALMRVIKDIAIERLKG